MDNHFIRKRVMVGSFCLSLWAASFSSCQSAKEPEKEGMFLPEKKSQIIPKKDDSKKTFPPMITGIKWVGKKNRFAVVTIVQADKKWRYVDTNGYLTGWVIKMTNTQYPPIEQKNCRLSVLPNYHDGMFGLVWLLKEALKNFPIKNKEREQAFPLDNSFLPLGKKFMPDAHDKCFIRDSLFAPFAAKTNAVSSGGVVLRPDGPTKLRRRWSVR